MKKYLYAHVSSTLKVTARLFWCISFGFFNTGYAQQTILWGTGHSTDEYDRCSNQHRLLEEIVLEKPGQLAKYENPGLALSFELLRDEDTTEVLFQNDDKHLKNYLIPFIQIKNLENSLASGNNVRSIQKQIAKYWFYLTNKTNQDYPILGVGSEVIEAESKKSYFQTIKPDFEHYVERVAFVDGGFAGMNPSEKFDRMEVATIFLAYVQLSRQIANAYYNKHIKPSANIYDITISDVFSEYYGKKIFTLANPESLFQRFDANFLHRSTSSRQLSQHQPLLSRRISDDEGGKTVSVPTPVNQNNRPTDKQFEAQEKIVLVWWRDYFIAKSIENSIIKNATNSLHWFGDAHTEGVAQFLYHSSKLSSEQKENIQVISFFKNRNLACDYKIVLDKLLHPDHKLMLPTWIKENTKNYVLSVYSRGALLYQDKKHNNTTLLLDHPSMRNYIEKLLKEQSSFKPGIFLVSIGTEKKPDMHVKTLLIQ